eukprot:scaffold48_cov311-Pinguiococcus_pyrenoidosus.AAC.90
MDLSPRPWVSITKTRVGCRLLKAARTLRVHGPGRLGVGSLHELPILLLYIQGEVLIQLAERHLPRHDARVIVRELNADRVATRRLEVAHDVPGLFRHDLDPVVAVLPDQQGQEVAVVAPAVAPLRPVKLFGAIDDGHSLVVQSPHAQLNAEVADGHDVKAIRGPGRPRYPCDAFADLTSPRFVLHLRSDSKILGFFREHMGMLWRVSPSVCDSTM